MISGKHHYNCAYCIHKGSAPEKVLHGKVRYKGICTLTNANMALFPHAGYPMPEDCHSYIQVNCGCAECKTGIKSLQLVERIDK